MKEHIISAANTFLAAALTVLAISFVESPTIEWSTAFWGGIILAAVRAGVKALLVTLAPKVLGTPKKK